MFEFASAGELESALSDVDGCASVDGLGEAESATADPAGWSALEEAESATGVSATFDELSSVVVELL